MSLPEDVVDHVLGFLQSDLHTLQQCAQSHPMLFRLSERHLYANVVLCDDFHVAHESLSTSKFIKLVGQWPGIAKHVRTLTVYINSPMLLNKHLCGVASLLPMFSGLNNLEIKSINGYFSWRRVPCMFHQSFLDFLHTQGKKKVLILLARYFPLSLLNICNDVRVTLDKCEHTQYDEESNTKDVEPFEHLSLLRCSEACLESITAWPRIHSLRSLEYKVGWCFREPENFLPRMVVACSNSLTTFCLDLNYYFDNSTNLATYDRALLTLAGLCRLERLTVKAEIICPPESPFPIIAEVILTALASPSLKEIFLEFKSGEFSKLNAECIWLPFVPLVAACSSRFIPIYISQKFCLVNPVCEELTPYIERGVVIMIPEISTN